MRPPLWLLPLLVGAAGCDAILGISDHAVGDSDARAMRDDAGSGTGSGSGRPPADAGRDARRDARDAGTDAPACVPSPPDGWAGPLAVQTQRAVDGGLPVLVECPESYEGTPVFDGVGQPDETPASCECGCRPPTGLVCGATLSTFTDDVCSMNEMGLSAPTTCMGLPSGTKSIAVGPATLMGNCQASGVSPMLLPPSWTEEVRLCSPGRALVACEGDRVVVPPPGAPYAATNYCVTSTTADAGCPPAYQTQHVWYPFATGSMGLTDTRSCFCNCSDPVSDAGCGEGNVTFFQNGSCMGGPTEDHGTGTLCAQITDNGGVKLTPAPAPPAACTPSQVNTGMVTPMGMPTTTVCCLQ